MPFLNPFTVLRLADTPLADISQNALSAAMQDASERAKAAQLTVHGHTVTLPEFEASMAALENQMMVPFYHQLAALPHMERFLMRGDPAELLEMPEHACLREPAFMLQLAPWLSPLFRDAFVSAYRQYLPTCFGRLMRMLPHLGKGEAKAAWVSIGRLLLEDRQELLSLTEESGLTPHQMAQAAISRYPYSLLRLLPDMLDREKAALAEALHHVARHLHTVLGDFDAAHPVWELLMALPMRQENKIAWAEEYRAVRVGLSAAAPKEIMPSDATGLLEAHLLLGEMAARFNGNEEGIAQLRDLLRRVDVTGINGLEGEWVNALRRKLVVPLKNLAERCASTKFAVAAPLGAEIFRLILSLKLPPEELELHQESRIEVDFMARSAPHLQTCALCRKNPPTGGDKLIPMKKETRERVNQGELEYVQRYRTFAVPVCKSCSAYKPKGRRWVLIGILTGGVLGAALAILLSSEHLPLFLGLGIPAGLLAGGLIGYLARLIIRALDRSPNKPRYSIAAFPPIKDLRAMGWTIVKSPI